ncbi:MAG: hypothetical protein V7727_18635, partial [Sneathiella sp.]
ILGWGREVRVSRTFLFNIHHKTIVINPRDKLRPCIARAALTFKVPDRCRGFHNQIERVYICRAPAIQTFGGEQAIDAD